MTGASSRQETRKLSAGPSVRVSSGTPAAVRQRWPCTWKVWCSEPIAITSHWTRSPTSECSTGVLPTKARPLIVWKSPIGASTETNSRSGFRSWRPRIESMPQSPPSREWCIDGEWSWYGQTPAEFGPALSL